MVKKYKNVKIERRFIVVCTLIENGYASLLFSQTFFSYCFCMLSEFAKVFERKVWRVQAAHLRNAARAKNPNRMWFSVALVKFHWFGIYWHVFNQSQCRNCCLYIIQKITPQARSGKYFQKCFFPDLGEKMAVFWACACKLSWTLFSLARVQPL